MAQVVTLLGYIAFAWNDISRATALTEEALTLFRELGDRYGIAETLHQFGDIVREQGDYVRATALLEESLTVCRELGNKQEIALVLNGLGDVAVYQGDFARAAGLYQEALSLLRELESKASIPWVLRKPEFGLFCSNSHLTPCMLKECDAMCAPTSVRISTVSPG